MLFRDARPAASSIILTLAGLLFLQPAGFAFADDAVKAGTKDTAAKSDEKSEKGSADQAKPEASKPAAEKPAAEEPKKRLITVSGNRTTLNIEQWPLLGKKDAKYLFVEMFDYTCPHCRATHQALRGAMERYGDDLAVIALPVPMDGSCHSPNLANHSYTSGGCELARLAVAVWRVDAKKFLQFHNWLFESSYARNSTEARQYAAQLVGEEALRKELAQPWCGKYVAKHVELYQRSGSGSIPKLLFPKSTLSGEVSSAETLCQIIERELGQQ